MRIFKNAINKDIELLRYPMKSKGFGTELIVK